MAIKIEISTGPDIVGHQIGVKVTADGGDLILHVTVRLDGWELGADSISPPAVMYERVFAQAGGYSPGVRHTVVVSARPQGKPLSVARKTWTDS